MSKNLFMKLLSLHSSPVPEEDFFIEVVAWLFCENPTLLRGWLERVFEMPFQFSSSQVRTQVPFEALEGHPQGSQVDLVIELYSEDCTQVFFIESKIGSMEGEDQLARYAHHLTSAYSTAKLYLLYITKFYDPKGLKDIYKFTNDPRLCYRQCRWADFYNFLKNYTSDMMVQEVRNFMKEEGMAEIERFTPSLMVGFSAFNAIFRFLKNSLDNDVQEPLKRIMENRVEDSQRIRLLEQQSGYKTYAYDKSRSWYCMVGYEFPEQFDDYPNLVMVLAINGSEADNNWTKIADAFKNIQEESRSREFRVNSAQLNEPGTWAYIRYSVSMAQILSNIDHRSAVKQQFNCFFDELERIKQAYPYLWQISKAQ